MRVIKGLNSRCTLLDLITGKETDFHLSDMKPFVFDSAVINPQDNARRVTKTTLSFQPVYFFAYRSSTIHWLTRTTARTRSQYYQNNNNDDGYDRSLGRGNDNRRRNLGCVRWIRWSLPLGCQKTSWSDPLVFWHPSGFWKKSLSNTFFFQPSGFWMYSVSNTFFFMGWSYHHHWCNIIIGSKQSSVGNRTPK